MRKWIVAALVILAILVLFGGVSTYGQSPVDAGTIDVYGSTTCPWCVKQIDYFTQKGIPYNFTDCTTEMCPDFVQGFPTLVIQGQIKPGYTETSGPLIRPVF